MAVNLPRNTAVTISIPTPEPASLSSGVDMPDRDVRHAGDESVFRMWNEVRRRTVRIGILLLSDTVAGLLGVQVALMSWALVSNHGLRPVPRIVPLLAMVFCIQPLALAAAGAY